MSCPVCGGPADNGYDRCIPPNAYYCTRCEAAPMIDAIEIQFCNTTLTVDFSCNEVCIICGDQDITDLVGKHERAEIIEIASAKLYELNAA